MKPRSIVAANLALAFAFSAVVLTAFVAGERHNDSVVLSAPACPTVETPPSADVAIATLQESTENAAPMVAEEDFAKMHKAQRQAALDEDDLNKVRQAARDLMRDKYPGRRVEGVFTLPLARSNGFYLAGADAMVDKEQRSTYYMLVSLYVRKNGSSYWRAESLGEEAAAALLSQK